MVSRNVRHLVGESAKTLGYSMYESRVNKLSSDVAALNKKLAREKDVEAKKLSQLTAAQRSAAKTRSASMLRSKENKINSLQKDLVRSQKSIADLQTKLASKTKELSAAKNRLDKRHNEQEKSRRRDELKHEKDLTKEVQRRYGIQKLHEELLTEFPDYETAERGDQDTKYDIFISHASQDKEQFAEPLARQLTDMGFRVWYDDFVLKVGDSLRRSTDRGIANSEYGLVVLSPHFFAKGWTERELDGLTAREIAGRRKLILPVWHNVDEDDVREYSPPLADKYALRTGSMDIQEIAEAVAEVLPGLREEGDPEEHEK